jgi:lipoate---protein ligase
MKWLDLTLADPARNLACEEALLDQCEAQGREVLRVWEAAAPFVVLGYANRVDEWVDRAACQRLGVPILRRCSGGGAVVQAQGCLNYAVTLRAGENGPLGSITGANRWIMERQRRVIEHALRSAGAQHPAGPCLAGAVEVCGDTDLAVRGRKCSGNAQRRKRQSLLFHGSILWGLDFALVGQCLRGPSRQPAYRDHRSHEDFMTNLPVSPAGLKESLRTIWEAEEPLETWPEAETAGLADEKYTSAQWNLRW